MLHHGISRHDRDLSTNPVLIHGKGRNSADDVTGHQAGHAIANRLHFTRSLIAKFRRQHRHLWIDAAAEHGFGAVKAQRPDLHANFPRTRGAQLHFI
jgi:hypothetical protein